MKKQLTHIINISFALPLNDSNVSYVSKTNLMKSIKIMEK